MKLKSIKQDRTLGSTDSSYLELPETLVLLLQLGDLVLQLVGVCLHAWSRGHLVRMKGTHGAGAGAGACTIQL